MNHNLKGSCKMIYKVDDLHKRNIKSYVKKDYKSCLE